MQSTVQASNGSADVTQRISPVLTDSGLSVLQLPRQRGRPRRRQDLQNTRSNDNETKIGVGNVAKLQVKWAFTTGGDVSGTPAVDGANVYVPDWAGNLYAVSRATGPAGLEGVDPWSDGHHRHAGPFGGGGATSATAGTRRVHDRHGHPAATTSGQFPSPHTKKAALAALSQMERTGIEPV